MSWPLSFETQTSTNLRLQEFFDDEVPQYIILSHTWGSDEVTFQDLDRPDHTKKRGYVKIDGICCLAARNGIKWVWVDTCCIDKTSSAELSEAINSMYRWYRDSQVCYAYLEDVQQADDPSSFDSQFSNSRWFTRGWTLQELLAPETVEFFDAAWEKLGTRSSLAPKIEPITSIPADILKRYDVSSNIGCAKIAMRMSWAARRQTTRVEDRAYSLLGIFGVNMPLLYGEGERAFERLQIEIMKQSSDDSILAWALEGEHKPKPTVPRDDTVMFLSPERALARCPDEFAWWTSTQPVGFYANNPCMEMTTRGLRVTLPVLKVRINLSYGVLNCMMDNNFDQFLAVTLHHTDVANEYERSMDDPITLSWQAVKKCQQMTVHIANNVQPHLPDEITGWDNPWSYTAIRIQGSDDGAELLVGVEPEHSHRKEWSCIQHSSRNPWPQTLLYYKKIIMGDKQDSGSDADEFVVVIEERSPLSAFFSLELKPPPFVCYTISMPKGEELEQLMSGNQHERFSREVPHRDLSKLRNSFSLKAGVPRVKIQREKFLDQELFLLKIFYTKSLAQYAMPITRTIKNLRSFVESQWAHILRHSDLLMIKTAFVVLVPYVAWHLNSKSHTNSWKEDVTCDGLVLLNLLLRYKAALTISYSPMARWMEGIDSHFEMLDLTFAVLIPFSMYTFFPRTHNETKVNPLVSVLCTIAIILVAKRGPKYFENSGLESTTDNMTDDTTDNEEL
ncbi:HET domain-containing protein [Colletotrichum fioriniae PJ7]|uniref:HET domain-containing protein n=1 Tax=Colletotrichum fioriniae PJ7 TaxID=1445577 RepID=A0A010QDQ6_9PEZI|nr:HET domain-containing protein [Colletotrichum fioriniae PJ7]